ncbi:acyl-CoA thioesterase [Pseudobacteriovorax antillogorgiicola]|uniref:Acyl-CoA thioesterase FadM n=1 Tax=Pseudobacteriovorax antillogorgiicola TaxID=1513793 RepID=A0A1Y6BLX6_9BACT|nr:acyl-CoA thioesterase [Pseudobacteriovorax antillogorgiicola]TCS54695.1 acyl-CoA thioesterase FadM [Pseudobacteriovorax antillogorgiicola]SMF16396.1 Acyl-CoA thioesterase FadM [Pseudobacteriovorax antillogorgiicola]
MISYFLRHLLVAFRSDRSKIESFNQEFELSLHSWPTDCDSNIHVNTARYFVYMELARFDISLRSGLFSYCRRKKIAPLVLGAKVTYRREIKPFQKVTIKSKILGHDHRFIYFEQRIVSNKGIHAKGYLRVAFYKNGFVDPKVLNDVCQVPYDNHPLPADVKLWIESEDLILAELNQVKD